MIDIIKEYENNIIKILQPLGVTKKNYNGRFKRYMDVDKNAFNEIKKLYIHTISSYNEEILNKAITNIMPTLYLVEDKF